MKLVILAGGGGSRLWPLSQGNTPKQFIALDGEKTMLEKTIERLLPLVQDPQDILISTTEALEEQVKACSSPYGIIHIITEPSRRNTAPAFGLVLSYLQDLGTIGMEPCIFFPADHEITPSELFHQYIHASLAPVQQGNIVLFGIKPTKPETGYGYIKIPDSFFAGMVADIETFVEKPNLEKALEYVASGHYFRNGGIFAGSFGSFCHAFKVHSLSIYTALKKGYNKMKEVYDTLPDISIDYAIMERISGAKMIPMFLNRSDMGCRDAVYDFSNKNLEGNVIQGNRDCYEVTNSLLFNTTNIPAKVMYTDNMIFVITDQGNYITRRGTSQDIKKIL